MLYVKDASKSFENHLDVGWRVDAIRGSKGEGGNHVEVVWNSRSRPLGG